MSGNLFSRLSSQDHEQWLDCSSCHPELFNIKKKTTRSLRMNNMVKESPAASVISVWPFRFMTARDAIPV